MDDQNADATAVRRALPWTVAFAAVCALLALFLGSGPAGAATENAQLSLTGPVDGNNPAGGSQLGVRPGTTINFSASAAPTQKVKDLAGSLGLGGLLNGLGTVGFQVVANFSGLPGGHSNTKLTGSSKASFHFSRVGTYSFSYQAQTVSVNLLGQKQSPVNVNLDGNQAKKAHVALNASNQYVGKIVVSNSPKNGISIQLPSVQVHPNIGKLQLPKIKIPGIQAPTVHATVPNLNKPKTGTKKTTNQPATTNSGPGAIAGGTDGLLPVPSRVVPGGYGSTTSSGAGGGGFYGSTGTGSSANSGYAPLQLTNPDGTKTTLGGTPAADSTQPSTTAADSASKSSPAAQLPVVLAIVAIIALALVASTYARLFLLRRNT